MAIYRITRFKTSDAEKTAALAEAARAEVSQMGADFIDVAFDEEGNGAVVARYPDVATMENATATAQKVFGQMVADGAMDGASIQIWSGDVKVSL
ncbi:MAG: hypothetical protein EBY36_07395 [Gammaproteobacteria bacterium]|jgi:hypothetical protein|nr:hypothetical protein [Gammaproteobacteria bacterium]NDG44532.1 hypothetical protein [Gammaproteobacteria bacterium]